MKTWLSWSSGKDSAWSLNVLRSGGRAEVTGLFTTVNAAFDRVAMHAVRRELLEAQARAAGLVLHVIEIPHPCRNALANTEAPAASRPGAADRKREPPEERRLLELTGKRKQSGRDHSDPDDWMRSIMERNG